MCNRIIHNDNFDSYAQQSDSDEHQANCVCNMSNKKNAPLRLMKNMMKFFFLILLVVDVFIIIYNQVKYYKDMFTYISTITVVLLSIFCIYVRLSATKSKKKEHFQKIERRLSNTLLSIILVENILSFIFIHVTLIIERLFNLDNHGLLILIAMLFPFYIGIYTYPFIFIYLDHKISKLILKTILYGVLSIFLTLVIVIYK